MGNTIATPTLAASIPTTRTAPWAVNAALDTGTDTPIAIKAAPGAGKSLYLTEVVLSAGAGNIITTADCSITVQDEDATVLLGPVELERAGSDVFVKHWKVPCKVPANKALHVVNTDGNPFVIYVEGFTV